MSRDIKEMFDLYESMKEDGVAENHHGESFPPYEEDVVNRPRHYQTESGLEAIHVIDDFVPDAYSYYMGNVIKYILRHINKNQKQDLEKARWYLDKMIKEWD